MTPHNIASGRAAGDVSTIAIVGSGVVGRGWIPVFARGGCTVRVYDPDPDQLRRAAEWVSAFEAASRATDDGGSGVVSYHGDLERAVADADYVQESIVEDVVRKRNLFAQISNLVRPETYIASSTSSLDINEIAAAAQHRHRCFTVHPFNPAAVTPVVEVMGTRSAREPDTFGLISFLSRLGQIPVILKQFVPGHVGNRLQAAVMREALHLVQSGVVDPNEVDALMSHGLALRWAFLGVFGTNHTNDDKGLSGYYARFWQSYCELMATLACDPPSLSAEALAEIAAIVDRRFESAPVATIARWRDRNMLELRRLQAKLPFEP